MGRVLADSAGGNAWIEEGGGENLACGHGPRHRGGADDVGAVGSARGGEGTEGDDFGTVEGGGGGRGGRGFDSDKGDGLSVIEKYRDMIVSVQTNVTVSNLIWSGGLDNGSGRRRLSRVQSLLRNIWL